MSEELLDLDGVEDEPLDENVAMLDASDVVAIDAPREDKLRFEAETERRVELDRETGKLRTHHVALPGDAARNAAGGREPLRGQHNWIPAGPRNVGGMVKALAIHPTDPLIMYAGGDSGGVFRSRDGAESWEPLWHDEAGLAVSALSISPSNPDVVWAGTGSRRSSNGNGIYRTSDGGDNWTNPSTGDPVPGTGDDKATRFEALAAHPTDDQHCWAVGPEGIFRTTDGGGTWAQFQAGTHFSDVAFATKAGTPLVFLVQAENGDPGNFGHIYRIPAATADVDAALGVAANRSRIRTHTAVPNFDQQPARAKLAICANTPDVAYVRWTDRDTNANGGKTINVYRTRNAIAANNASNISWRRLPRSADWRSTDGSGDFHEGQAGHNLSIAVNPDDPNEVATGMIDLHVSTNANANNRNSVSWKRATAWDTDFLEPGQHADNHAALFRARPGAAPGDQPGLWVGNDGGVSVSTNWREGDGFPRRSAGLVNFPLDGDEVRWHKRSHGISATQMYDLTQSPLVPSMYGCGFQDRGLWVTTGGDTWTVVLGADGGFVAWDPDDPYRFFATWQSGISEVEFPGRLEGTLPRPGDGILNALWPREVELGFLPTDGARFVADTAHHPRQARRVLHARRNRVYGRRISTGDHWEPEPAGHGVELIVENPGNEATIEVRPSTAAYKLGLLPQVAREQDRVRIKGIRIGPHSLANGDKLALTINGAARPDVEFLAGDVASGRSLGDVTTGELCDIIRRKEPQVNARPVFWPDAASVVLVTHKADGTGTIAVGGTACWLLGVAPGTYRAAPNAPAVLRLGMPSTDRSALLASPVPTLTVQIDGGTTRTVRLEPPDFADLANGRVLLDELAAALDAALDADPVDVSPAPMTPQLELRATAGNQLTLSGGAADLLGVSGSNDTSFLLTTGFEFRLNLTPPAGGADLTIAIDDGATAGPALQLNTAAGIADITQADTAELTAILTTYANNNGLRVAASDEGIGVRLTGQAGAQLTVSGTALVALGLPTDGVARPVQALSRMGVVGFNLAGLAMTVDDNTNPPRPALTFDQALVTANLVNDLQNVTLFELAHLLQRHLTPPVPGSGTDPVAARADMVYDYQNGSPQEITFSPSRPDRVWIGSSNGVVMASDDNGATYRQIRHPRMMRSGRPIEAIGFHPTDADVAYVGMRGQVADANDHGFVFRTLDGGDTWEHIGGTVVDSSGDLVEVRAIETDRTNPDVVYVGSRVGVFRSTNRGDSFDPFNEGLPNADVIDLAYEPTTAMLRVGLWGRGVYHRHVGDRPPVDTHLYVRTTYADVGVRPVPRGPAGLALAPEPELPSESPDIKVNRHRPGRVGGESLIDGAEFDDELENEAVTPGESNVFLQVHNAGAFSATGVRVVALWADASGGPPPLPDDFWTQYGAGGLPAEVGSWRLVGDGPLADPDGLGKDRVEPDYPRVLTFRPDFPADVAGMRRIGILLIATCAEDAIDATEVDVVKLVGTERRVAYREVATITEAEDELVFLSATRGAQLSVAGSSNPSALTRLFPAAAGPAAELRGLAEPDAGFDLSTTSARGRGIVLRSTEASHTITFDANDFANVGAATRDEVIRVLNHEFINRGMQIRAESWITGAGTPFVRLQAVGGTRFRIMGGTGAAALRAGAIPTGPAGARDLRTQPYALNDGDTFTLAINDEVTVRFESDDFGDISAARTHEVRRVLTREMRRASFPAVAVAPQVDLRVRRSVSAVTDVGAALGGAHLADLVASSVAVGAGDQADLFDLRRVLGTDTVGANNFLYLRSTNHGNASQPAARHRLFELDLTASPITHAAIGAPETDDLAPGASVINQFAWAPATSAVAGRRIVLAVVDHAAEAPLEPPANFAGLDELEDFCASNPNAAYRVFESP